MFCKYINFYPEAFYKWCQHFFTFPYFCWVIQRIDGE
jgi:hypothetical protein